MKLIKKPGRLLLAVWLVLTGLVRLVDLNFAGLGTLMAVLAIGAGVLTALRD